MPPASGIERDLGEGLLQIGRARRDDDVAGERDVHRCTDRRPVQGRDRHLGIVRRGAGSAGCSRGRAAARDRSGPHRRAADPRSGPGPTKTPSPRRSARRPGPHRPPRIASRASRSSACIAALSAFSFSGRASAMVATASSRRQRRVACAHAATLSGSSLSIVRTSLRSTGKSSASNQGLRLSQPLLRQDGCGSGSTRGRPQAGEDLAPAPDRRGEAAAATPRRDARPGRIGRSAGQFELRQRREQRLAPGLGAFPARRQVAALGVVAGKAGAHRARWRRGAAS